MATPCVSPVSLDADWAVGAMFGGHLAVVLTDAAIDATFAGLVPVSTSVAFLRPALPGLATVSATVVRLGRRYTVVSCTLETDAGPAATALVTLAPLDSLAVTPYSEPNELPPEPADRDGAIAELVDWRTVTPWRDGSSTGRFESWFRLRATESSPEADVARYLVASDLIGPAIAATGRALPFRIATVALDVTVIARTESPWLHQSIDVTVLENEAIARLDLREPGGALLATATHRVVLLPASDEELPLSVTAFGWGR